MTTLRILAMFARAALGRPYPNSVALVLDPASRAGYAAGCRARRDLAAAASSPRKAVAS